MFTQEQVNHFNAEAKRTAVTNYFKELGLDKPPTGEELSQTIQAATEYQKLKDGEKTEVQRLNGELATKAAEAEKVPTLEAQLLRARLAGDAGLKSRYWKYVEGDDEEAIKASIAETLQDIRGGGDGSGDEGEPGEQEQEQRAPAKKTGTGRLDPTPQQGAGGGSPPKPSMQAGADAYKAKRGA
jgi:hypothetical protein